jgi:glycosyltransferase involved in cell wall biosynthesis/GT2 family glycosyltransferase
MSNADIPADFGVNLIAYIRAEMGLGTAARGVAHALEAAQIPFNILNFEHSNPSLHRDESWRRKEVTSSSYDFTLFAVNPDNLANARERVQKKAVKDRYSIGYWFWELPEIPDDWQPSFDLVDEVWAASRFVQDSISRKSTIPVFRVPVPIRLGPTDRFSRQGFGLPENRFLFLTMADTLSHTERKNPRGVVRAFKKAFPGNDDHVGLVIKVNNANAAGSDEEAIRLLREEIDNYQNIYLRDAEMTRLQVDGLLGVTDSFVSLHRSEGFGLGPAEAMSLGKPVILTRWSGNTDYMTPTNSIGIDYQLIPVGKQRGPYEPDQLWAEPDIEQAAFWMSRLVADQELAQRIGRHGQETIQREFSPDAVGATIKQRLTFLHAAGVARRKSRSRVGGLAAPTQLQTFAARTGGPDRMRSTKTDVAAGQWTRVKIDLPWGLGDGSTPFRFDPVDHPGMVDLAAIVLRHSATLDTLWKASPRTGFNDLTIGGTALRLPNDRLLRLLSYDEDPQIYLPRLTGDIFEDPLTLEVLLRFDRAPAAIEQAVSNWNQQAVAETKSISVQPPALSGPGAVVEGTPRDAQVTMVVYSASDEGYSEDRSTQVNYTADRWSHLTIALQLGLGAGRLRLDPLTAVGLIDLAALTIKSAINDEVLWQANGGGELQRLDVSGSAVRIPHPNLARILSYGEDPQIYLPEFTGGKFDGPLRLEVWLKTETGIDSIRRGISELATLSVQALTASSHAQALLEQSSRALSERDEVLLRLSKADMEKEALAEQVASLKPRLDNAQHRLVLAENKLESTGAELEKARRDRTRAARDATTQRKEMERLERDLNTRALELEDLSRQITLLNNQLGAEYFGKSLLIEQVTLTAERLSSLKKELALLRQAEADRRRGVIGRLLGHSSPVVPPQPDSKSKNAREHRYSFWLDSPTSVAAADKIFLSGWVVPPAGEKVLGVRALVDTQIFLGQFGFERSDVAAAFDNRPDAQRPGFGVAISLPVGTHEIILQALISNGTWKKVYSYQQEVLARPLQSGTDSSAPVIQEGFKGWLETPRTETVLEFGLLLIMGWLHVEIGKVSEVIASVENGASVKLAHSLERRDVAGAFPDNPAAIYSGFEGYLPVEGDRFGTLRLNVEAVLETGQRIVCFQRDVRVKSPESDDSLPPPELSHDERYARWIETNKLTPYLVARMEGDAARLASTGPQISIIVPTFNTPAAYLEAMIDSVKKQIYPRWQLCIADDASTDPRVRPILEQAAASDSRINVVFRDTNGHIVQASNSALALAKGDYVGLLDHDDLLSPDALLHIAEAIRADSSLDLIYTDEDKLSAAGIRYDPMFKGSYSPEMSLTHNYIQHFTVIRKRLVNDVGGFREKLEGAQDLDLYLRVLEQTTPRRVKHLPFVCYHWRAHTESTASSGSQKSYVFDSARKGIAEAAGRRGLQAAPFLPEWAKAANCCLYQLEWSADLLKQNPVTIVIPTKNRHELLEKCLASLERTVAGDHVDVIIVDDFSDEKSAKEFMEGLGARKALRYRVIQPSSRSDTFNFSQLVNEGVAAATTPLVLLLNNDTEALTRGWLEDMVGWMSIEGVAAVGAKLLYPDYTIQHAGVVVGPHGGLADHLFHRLPENVVGFNFLTHTARNVSAVTAACLLTSKAAFEEVGGFDQEALSMEFNDVDFCLRLGKAGKRVVFTPQTTLLHHCGKSRGGGWRPAEHLVFLRRYRGAKDPYYNENLDLDRPTGTVNPGHFLHGGRVPRLKVLMVSHNLNLEGAPKVLFDHAAYFTKVGGYDVTVVSRQDGPLRRGIEENGMLLEIVEGVMPMGGEDAPAYKDRLRKTGHGLKVESFDLIVCNTLASVWGVVLGELFDLPVIWHVHESTTIDHFFHFEPLPAGLAENCFASADRVVFESGATRRLLSRYQKRDNFETIPGSIDVSVIDRFREEHSPRSMKLKYGLPPEKMVVNLIGTTGPRKGQHVFVEAIERLRDESPDLIANVIFLMLGARKSPYLDLLRTKLATVKGADVRLIEESSNVFDYYRLTDIFVCASFQESFPRVILEAMAFQLPIVTTNVFGIPEIIMNQSEALMVPPGDALSLAQAIGQLLVDPVARFELGVRAHAKVTRLFNSDKQLSRQLDLTKEVVARHE